MFKRKIGLGQTKLRLEGVQSDDETVEGVLSAMKALGGAFPEHIKSITIHESNSEDDSDNEVTRGICSRLDDKSRIHIYRKGLIDTSRSFPIDLIGEAKMTTLHEVDHANHGYDRHQSDSYTEDLSEAEQETRARIFANNNFMKK